MHFSYQIQKLKLNTNKTAHMPHPLNGVRPTVGKEELGRFMQFTRDFGSG